MRGDDTGVLNVGRRWSDEEKLGIVHVGGTRMVRRSRRCAAPRDHAATRSSVAHFDLKNQRTLVACTQSALFPSLSIFPEHGVHAIADTPTGRGPDGDSNCALRQRPQPDFDSNMGLALSADAANPCCGSSMIWSEQLAFGANVGCWFCHGTCARALLVFAALTQECSCGQKRTGGAGLAFSAAQGVGFGSF